MRNRQTSTSVVYVATQPASIRTTAAKSAHRAAHFSEDQSSPSTTNSLSARNQEYRNDFTIPLCCVNGNSVSARGGVADL